MDSLKKFVLFELELGLRKKRPEVVVSYDPQKKLWKGQSGNDFRRGSINQVIAWMRDSGASTAMYQSDQGTKEMGIKELGALGARLDQRAATPRPGPAPKAQRQEISIEDMSDSFAAFIAGSERKIMQSSDKSPEALDKLVSQLKNMGYENIKLPTPSQQGMDIEI